MLHRCCEVLVGSSRFDKLIGLLILFMAFLVFVACYAGPSTLLGLLLVHMYFGNALMQALERPGLARFWSEVRAALKARVRCFEPAEGSYALMRDS